MVKVSQIDKGDYLKIAGNIYQVIDWQHTHLGRGKANMLLVLKELQTGKRLEKNFKSDEEVELVELTEKEVVFQKKKAKELVFSKEKQTYRLPVSNFQKILPFLVPGRNYVGLFFEDRLLTIILPKRVHLKVISAPPGIKGNTVQATTKMVTVENGYQFKVPLFINTGDIIVVNTETGEYIERIQS